MVKEEYGKLETVPEDRRESLLHRSTVEKSNRSLSNRMKREIITSVVSLFHLYAVLSIA